jgi:hypothetical protein
VVTIPPEEDMGCCTMPREWVDDPVLGWTTCAALIPDEEPVDGLLTRFAANTPEDRRTMPPDPTEWIDPIDMRRPLWCDRAGETPRWRTGPGDIPRCEPLWCDPPPPPW